jgi:hypothetical protein
VSAPAAASLTDGAFFGQCLVSKGVFPAPRSTASARPSRRRARIVEAARSKHKEVVFGGAVAFSGSRTGVRNSSGRPGLDVPKVVEPMTQVDDRLRGQRHPTLAARDDGLRVDEVGPFTGKFNAKRARAGGSSWHQDHPFGTRSSRAGEGDRTLGVFLDDATRRTGRSSSCRGDHGPAPRRTTPDDVMVRYHADDAQIDTARAVVAEVPAGGV